MGVPRPPAIVSGPPAPTGPDLDAARHALVDGLIAAGLIVQPAIERAFRRVPRHLFVPHEPAVHSYRDEAIPVKVADGRVQSSSSQPGAMATMLDMSAVAPGMRVLEVGAGTGYNAAVLADLVGPCGHVTSIDIQPDVIAQARRNLANAGCDPVELRVGDGALGGHDGETFDRIMVSVGSWDVAPAWIAQIVADGRLVVPLSFRGTQQTVAFVRDGQVLRSVDIRTVGFMRLLGGFAGPEHKVALPGSGGAYVRATDRGDIDATGLANRLRVKSPAVVATEVRVSVTDVLGGLGFSLGLADDRATHLGIVAPVGEIDDGLVPRVVEWPNGQLRDRSTPALVEADQIAYLAWSADGGTSTSHPAEIRHHGDEALAEHLAGQIQAWDHSGRPGVRQFSVTCAPHDVDADEWRDGRETTLRRSANTLLIHRA